MTLPIPTHPILDGFQLQPGPPARHEQLFRFLHDAIASGLLTAGSRLPPTRKVAANLKTSRQTVVIAYERLLMEGMIEGQQGTGTFVSSIAGSFANRANETRQKELIVLSKRSKLIMDDVTLAEFEAAPPLRPGIPDLENFPFNVLSKLSTRYWRSHDALQLAYGDGAGLQELRDSVAQFLRTFRGVACTSEQIIITNGTQASISTVAHAVADPGDLAIVENPGHPMTHRALLLAGLKLLPMTIDHDGIQVTSQPGSRTKPKLLVCTPSHQYPLGVTTSLSRRLELLEWADSTGGLIIEDDYDSEFRYSGAPVPALAVLDQGRGRVVYAGTFSKLLAPGLRLGYLVVPEQLIRPLRAVRMVFDRHPSAPIQKICSEFIAGGYLAAHIRKMKPIYAERRAVLIDTLEAYLGENAELVGTHAGLHACALMKDETAEQRAFDLAQSMSLGCLKLSSFTAPGGKTHYWGLALGFATTDAVAIRKLVTSYAKTLSALCAKDA